MAEARVRQPWRVWIFTQQSSLDNKLNCRPCTTSDDHTYVACHRLMVFPACNAECMLYGSYIVSCKIIMHCRTLSDKIYHGLAVPYHWQSKHNASTSDARIACPSLKLCANMALLVLCCDLTDTVSAILPTLSLHGQFQVSRMYSASVALSLLYTLAMAQSHLCQ